MIPVEFSHFEHFDADEHENNEADNLLNHLQFNQAKRSSVDFRTDPVCWNHGGIFKQRHAPTRQDNEDQRPILDNAHIRQLQIAVPRKGHKDVRNNQKQNCINASHIFKNLLQKYEFFLNF